LNAIPIIIQAASNATKPAEMRAPGDLVRSVNNSEITIITRPKNSSKRLPTERRIKPAVKNAKPVTNLLIGFSMAFLMPNR